MWEGTRQRDQLVTAGMEGKRCCGWRGASGYLWAGVIGCSVGEAKEEKKGREGLVHQAKEVRLPCR